MFASHASRFLGAGKRDFGCVRRRSIPISAGVTLSYGVICLTDVVTHHRRVAGVFLLFLALVVYGGAGSAGEKPKAYVLVIDELTWDNLLDERYPALRQVVSHGAVGLMTTRTAGATTAPNAAVTIGSSGRALGVDSMNLAFDKDTVVRALASDGSGEELFVSEEYGKGQESTGPVQPAAEVYRRRMGISASGQVLNLAAREIQVRNLGSQFGVTPGSLGQALSDGGVVTAYVGNSDIDSPVRHLSALFMDTSGQIPLGAVDLVPTQDVVFPFGVRADYELVWEKVRSFVGQADLIAIELGDLTRVNRVAGQYTPQQLSLLRHLALAHMDRFVSRLLASIGPSDYMTILVPSPASRRMREGDSLVPFVLYQPSQSGGILSSPSTRWPGLVTNLDVGPTLLSLFGLPVPETMYGRPAIVAPSNDAVAEVISLRDRIVATSRQRNSILRQLVYVNIGLYVAGTLFILLGDLPRWFGRIISFMLPAAMSMPLALLLLPLIGSTSPQTALVWSILISTLTAALAWLIGRQPVRLAALLALATTAAVLADTLTGSYLIRNSILGYDPMGGARFYGIGNEYMGVLVGAVIVGVAPLLDIFPHRRRQLQVAAAMLFGVVAVAISLPVFGANVGGGITAAAGFSLTLFLLLGYRLGWRQVAVVALLPVALICANTIIDTWLSDTGVSHLGQAVSAVGQRGLAEAYTIIVRKVSMNLKLFRYSVWTKALLVALGVIAWFSYRPSRLMLRIKERYGYLVNGFAGATAAATTALLFNDSGVVAAALVLNFTASVILFLGTFITLEARRAERPDKQP